MPVERLREDASELVLDDEWFPIVIATFFGRSTLAQVEALHAWLDRVEGQARERGSKLVLITDAGSAGRPDPAVRRRLADRMLAPDVAAGVVVVLSSPLLRGTVTAISWLAGDRFNNPTICGTMAEAMDHSFTALRIHGQALPARDPASYVPPGYADVAASG